jgi:leucoanthocyanidin reductase
MIIREPRNRHALLMRKYNVCAQRFLPSEFGHDIDRADPVEPGLTMYKEKRQVRRYIEEAGIPYTYICCNSIAAWPYHDNTHPADVPPPLDRFQIYGDGTVKGAS